MPAVQIKVKLAIEYNGVDHLRPGRALRDLEREQLLVAAGWRIVRFDAVTALHYPRTIAARVRQELRARGVPAIMTHCALVSRGGRSGGPAGRSVRCRW
jgi:very-short-patch-repair endonuclease